MEIIKDTQQHLVLQEVSTRLSGVLFLLSFCLIPIVVIPMLIWDSLGVNTLNCQRLKSTHINCTVQKFNVLGRRLEYQTLNGLREGKIVETENPDSDESHTIYTLALLDSHTRVSFCESRAESYPITKLLDTLQSFINDPERVSFFLETAPEFFGYIDIIVLTFVTGIWLLFFGVLPLRYYLLSRNTNYYFDQTTRYLRIELYNRRRKITENKIPFKQIEKITLQEKNKLIIDEEDGNRTYTTWSLFLHPLNSEPLLIWRTDNSSEHSKISQIAQRVAKITGAKYDVSSDVAEAAIYPGKPPSVKIQAKAVFPAPRAKKKFFVWLIIILLIILFTTISFRIIQTSFSNEQYLELVEFFTPDPAENEFSPWLSENSYQRQFERMAEKKRYPIQIEGRENNDILEFRARFATYPPGEFYFYSWVGDSSWRYEAKGKKLSAQKFRRVWHHEFTTSRGTILHQTTWIKYNAE